MNGGRCRVGRRRAQQQGSRKNGLRIRTESRIPPAKDVLPVTIEHACANLQQQVGAPMAQRICCFFTMRRLTTWFTVDSTNPVLIRSPLR